MPDIATEHRGFKITFSENQEVWRCWDLDFESPSLLRIKQRIDAHERKKRKKADLIQVWCVPHNDDPYLVWVSSVDEASSGPYSEDKCWVLREPKAGGKKEREKVGVKQLVKDNEEGRAAIEKLKAAKVASRLALEAVKEASAACPRFTRDELLAHGVNEDQAEAA